MLLNTTVKVKLASSPIHGVGVFAIKPIKKGERCFVRRMKGDTQIIFDLSWSALQEVDQEVRDIIVGRWPQVVNGSKFFFNCNDDARSVSFVNHSDTPNYNPFIDVALEDISVGAEITENYRTVDNYLIAYPFLA